MELTQDEKDIVDNILKDIGDLQKEFTRLFFYREVRRELIVEKLAEAHLKLAELALARDITNDEIQEKIRTYHEHNHKTVANLIVPYLKLVK